jgi:hypothetical protein
MSLIRDIRSRTRSLAACAVVLWFAGNIHVAQAYETYNSGCANCHGAFTSSTSTKTPPTVFPSNDKHYMHRNNSAMGTSCNLCHSSGDNDDPFTGFSDGVGTVAGVGCTGCHEPLGLRAHHVRHGVSCIGGCHSAGTPPAESVNPPYYGTAYTKAKNAANNVLAANTNENWSVGDYLGLDNDGDGLYDQADFDCGPAYRMSTVTRSGNDLRITWQTVGGRKDALQASGNIASGYADASPAISIAGVGPVTTNYLHVGGATNQIKFYRVRNAP